MNRQEYIELRNRFHLKENRFSLQTILIQNLLLAAAIAVIWSKFAHSLPKLLTIPLISIFLFRNFGLMHEAVHGVASKNRKINDLIGVISAGFCLLSFDTWRKAHLEHHQWSGNIDKDPVMSMVKIFPLWPKPVQKILSLGWRAWMPILSILQHSVFWSLSIRYFFRMPKTFLGFTSLLFPIALLSGAFSMLPWSIVASTLVPAIALYLIFTEVVNAPHHLGLPHFRGEEKLPLWNQFLCARTCIYPRWLARFVVLNFNYHTAHHMFPRAPWYQLDEIHAFLMAELKDQYSLDPQFAWVMRNRKKDLVDVFVTAKPSEVERKLAG